MQTLLNIVFWPVRSVIQARERRRLLKASIRAEAAMRERKRQEHEFIESEINLAMAQFDLWWQSGGKVK